MSSVAPEPPALSDTELVELLALVRQSDSVELKLTVPADHQRSSITALGLDPLGAEARLVYFFDTPDLALDRHGLVVRARRIQGRREDTVVKLRPIVPSELADEVRDLPTFVVEVDAMPGKYVCSGSLKGNPKRAGVLAVVEGARPVHRLFSKEQRAFFADHAPDGVELDALSVLGPIFVLKIKTTPVGYNRKLASELWLFPDGSRVLELSTRCLPAEAFQVAAEARAFLSERGISRAGAQQTKTRKALEHFSG